MKVLPVTTKGHTPHQRDPPPPPILFILVAAMGKCKQDNEFQWFHYGHLTSLIIIRELELPQSAIHGFLPQIATAMALYVL